MTACVKCRGYRLKTAEAKADLANEARRLSLGKGRMETVDRLKAILKEYARWSADHVDREHA